MEKRYDGLLLASILVNGVYTLAVLAFFLVQGVVPSFTVGGAMAFVLAQALLALLLKRGYRLEVLSILLIALYVLLIGRILIYVDSFRLNTLVSGEWTREMSLGRYVSLHSYGTTWLSATNPGTLLGAGMFLSACVARLAARGAARRQQSEEEA